MSLIVAKSAMRVPFAGGLSDLPEFIAFADGATASCTIDKYVYVVAKKNLGPYYRLRYQDTFEKVSDVDHVKNDLIREALRMTALDEDGLDVTISADVSPESGLGASGALAVALITALRAVSDLTTSKEEAMRLACQLEVEILAQSGFHDPAISVAGGLNRIDYPTSGEIRARRISLGSKELDDFSQKLLFFYGGRHTPSKPSLDLLRASIQEARPILADMVGLVDAFCEAAAGSRFEEMGQIIGAQQELKRRLPGRFDSDYVANCVALAKSVGAYTQLPGGKIGAFVVVCAPHGELTRVREAFAEFEEVPVQLVDSGPSVQHI